MRCTDAGGRHPWLVPLLLILAAMAWIPLDLRDGGPGVTWDEAWYVYAGALYTRLLPADHSGMATPWAYNHEHPPLAKYLMGLGEWCAAALLPRRTDVLLLGARGAVMLLLGLTLAGAWLLALPLGRSTAALTVLLCLCCPRLVGHARLATLDLPLTCCYTWTLLAWERATLPGAAPPRRARRAWRLLACVLLAGSLLVKFTAVLLPLVLAASVFLNLLPPASRVAHGGGLRRDLVLLAAMCAGAVALFILGWPWLWQHTGERLAEYIQTNTRHAMTPVLYLGKIYGASFRGAGPPWHYAPVMLVFTSPVIVLLGWFFACTLPVLARRRGEDPPLPAPPCGRPGQVRKGDGDARRRRVLLLALLGGMALPAATMLPGSVCYDGVRLLLPGLPLLCLLAAWGWQTMVLALHGRPRLGRLAPPAVLLLAMLTAAVHLVRPRDELSYFNPLAGGVDAPRRWGLDPAYWGTAFRPALLKSSLSPLASRPEPRLRLVGFGGSAPEFMRMCGILPRNARFVEDDSWEALLVVPRLSYAPARKAIARYFGGVPPENRALILVRPRER